MADITDVSNALVGVIAAALYPNGTASPSVTGVPTIVYAGWPTRATLDADLLVGKAHVTVWPLPMERNTTRYPSDWEQIGSVTLTLSALVSGQTVTIGGTVGAGGVVSVKANGKAFPYAAQPSDTPTAIATALAALISVGIPGTTNAGPVITLPPSAEGISAQVGGGGQIARELRRQEKQYQVIVWADTPEHRDAIGAALDVSLAKLRFVALTDGFGARIIYAGSQQEDSFQKAKLYRRNMTYRAEFATTETQSAQQITQTQVNVGISPDLKVQQPINVVTVIS